MTTAVFIIISPQSLNQRHCLHLLRRWNTGGLMTAYSGRSCAKTQVSIKDCGRGLGLCDITLLKGYDKKKKAKHWVYFYHHRLVVYTHWCLTASLPQTRSWGRTTLPSAVWSSVRRLTWWWRAAGTCLWGCGTPERPATPAPSRSRRRCTRCLWPETGWSWARGPARAGLGPEEHGIRAAEARVQPQIPDALHTSVPQQTGQTQRYNGSLWTKGARMWPWSTKPVIRVHFFKIEICTRAVRLIEIEIKSRFEIARFLNRFIARFFLRLCPNLPQYAIRTNQNAAEQNRPGIQTDSMLKKQGRWVQNRIRTWWPKNACCMQSTQRGVAIIFPSEQRASFWRSRSARSIRSAPLAQPKMPFGNLLIPESVE